MMPTRPPYLAHLVLWAGLFLSLAGRPAREATQAAAAAVPAGFVDVLVADVGAPTALAFTPDDRLLITTQPGQLRVYQNGALLAQPALDLAPVICSNSERGLLGVAVDPAFSSNHFVYLYYTFKNGGICATGSGVLPVNRVSRFTLAANNQILTSTEVLLIDNIASTNGNHNGGDLHFGADGALYVSAGEAGNGSNAQNIDNLSGKILRINTNGTVPGSNPFASGARRCGDPGGVPADTGPCQEIFAYGLRNPFRFAFRPGTSQFYINDVGAGTWEEIDVGLLGANFGWSFWEGPCPSSDLACTPGTPSGTYTDPTGYYNHSTGCATITGGAFVPPGIWPAQYDNAYLFADFGCGKLFRLVTSGLGNYSAVEFATGLGNVVSLAWGPSSPSHPLYYTTYSVGGQVRRIERAVATNFLPIVRR